MLKIQDSAYIGEGQSATLTGHAGDPSSWHWAPGGAEMTASIRNGKLTVIHGGTGVYCVTPTAASGIDATTVQPTLTADYTGSLHNYTAMYASNAGACGGPWEVVIVNAGTQADDGFSILVP